MPPGPVTPLGAARALSGTVPHVSVTGADGTQWYLQGPLAPDLLTQPGIGLITFEGLQPSFDLLDEQGARQDGISNLDTVWNPNVLSMVLEAGAPTVAEFRQVMRMWISSWNPPNVNTVSVFTPQMGSWWAPARQLKALPPRTGSDSNQDPSLHLRFRFGFQARVDNAFWQGIDSVSVFPGGTYGTCPQTLTGGAASGYCPLTNTGTRRGWPRFLVTGPGTFTLGNGGNIVAQGNPAYASGYAPGIVTSGVTPITFGPLTDGQVALVSTLPRLRSVVDLTPTQTLPTNPQQRALTQTLINLAQTTNTAPLLEAWQNVFGVLPLNSPMYSLLGGRFTTSSALPPHADGYPLQTSWIPVSIVGGNSNSRIVAASTPYRTWPW